MHEPPAPHARPPADGAGAPPPAAGTQLSEPVPTGHPGLDARLRRLADTGHLPVTGHLAVYEEVHGVLRETLAALDRQPGPPAPGAAPGS